MQLMTWPLARLGSRFSLLFQPYQRRVMHSALGRFLDQPLDLAVGLVEPDGTERVLPFTQHGKLLYACEQFDRINSITFRGQDEKIGLRFELNVHAPFYPQNEKLCLAPMVYLEMRVTWAKRVRWIWSGQSEIDKVQLFIRLNRPHTQIDVADGRIDMSYDVTLDPRYERLGYEAANRAKPGSPLEGKTAHVVERIVSVNPDARPTETDTGKGLTLELPITEEGSGTKWRLVWAAHTGDEVLEVRRSPARFRYHQHFENLDAVLDFAVGERDDNLAHSRRFEKVIEQAPLIRPRRHLLHQGFQSYLSNTFWVDTEAHGQWFSNWEGSCMFHSTVDVEYNLSLLYFAVWPELLGMTIDQWTHFGNYHAPSDGQIMSHDMGRGMVANGQAYPHAMPVEENANFLLLLQAFVRWTGKTDRLQQHADFVEKLARYLLWTDRDGSGFAAEGTANTIDDASPAVQYARKQTYLAIKRVMGLSAAADLLSLAGRQEFATTCRDAVRNAVPQIETDAWLGDHYCVCVDSDGTGLTDVWSGKALPPGQLKGWDDYSIYTSNGVLLPTMVHRAIPFKIERLKDDLTNSLRETLTPYGCAHSSSDKTNIWVSQNIWRDTVGRYLHAIVIPLEPRYWDLQTFSNTGDQSFGFIDTYIGNELCFYPRGAVSLGFYLSGPRMRIDRLAEGGPRITIDPDRFRNSRWPLLPLADWPAGRIPVCVVNNDGEIQIEGEIEKITWEGCDDEE